MKCKCGGNTKANRVKVTHRGREYRKTLYKCKECQKEFYLNRIYVPLRKK